MRRQKIISAIILAAAAALGATAADTTPMLVFCDDQFSAFTRAEVDSVTFSRFDMDSVLRDQIATQVLWSDGHPSRFPIELTDSVSFATPDNNLLPGVREIKGALWDYVISCENGSVLHINPSIPEELLPRRGEKLVTTEMSAKFPAGFIGEVNSVDRSASEITVDCEPLGLSDVYSSFFGVFDREIANSGELSEATDPDEPQSRSAGQRAVTDDYTFKLPTFGNTIGLGYSVTLPGNINFGGAASLSVSVSPTVRVKTFVLIESFGRVFSTSRIIADFECEQTLSASYSGGYSRDFPFWSPPAVNVAPGVAFFLEGGINVNVSGTWGTEITNRQHYRLAALTSLTTGGAKSALNPTCSFRLVGEQRNIQNTIGSGSISVGAYVKCGIAALHKEVANVNIGANLEAALEFDAGVTEDDWASAEDATPAVYNKLSKEDAIKFGVYTGATVQAEALGGRLEDHFNLIRTYRPILQSSIIPRFRNTQVERRDDALNIVDVSADVTPGLIDCALGWRPAYVDENDRLVIVSDKEKRDLRPGTLSTSISNISLDKKWRVFPTVKVFNRYITASPSALVDDEANDCVQAKFIENYYAIASKDADKLNANPYLTLGTNIWTALSIPIESFDFSTLNLDEIKEVGYYIVNFSYTKELVEQFEKGEYRNDLNYLNNDYSRYLYLNENYQLPIYREGECISNPNINELIGGIKSKRFAYNSDKSESVDLAGAYGVYIKSKYDQADALTAHPWVLHEYRSNCYLSLENPIVRITEGGTKLELDVTTHFNEFTVCDIVGREFLMYSGIDKDPGSYMVNGMTLCCFHYDQCESWAELLSQYDNDLFTAFRIKNDLRCTYVTGGAVTTLPSGTYYLRLNQVTTNDELIELRLTTMYDKNAGRRITTSASARIVKEPLTSSYNIE